MGLNVCNVFVLLLCVGVSMGLCVCLCVCACVGLAVCVGLKCNRQSPCTPPFTGPVDQPIEPDCHIPLDFIFGFHQQALYQGTLNLFGACLRVCTVWLSVLACLSVQYKPPSLSDDVVN